MIRIPRLSLIALAVSMLASGCYGPFRLTRKVYQWNGRAGGKWEKEFMFIVLTWVPVYGLATLGDAIVFNSIEFWAGKDYVDDTGKPRSAMPQRKHIARDDNEALLTFTPQPGGAELLIQQVQHHHAAGSLHLERRDGMTVASDAAGHVMLNAQSMPDGSVLLRDAQGRTVVAYSHEQVDALVASATQVSQR